MSALFLTPLVIAQRMPQLVFEALHPNPMVKDESRLAVTEKISAFSEGMLAGQMAAMNAPLRMMQAMMSGRSAFSALMGAHNAVTKASIAPIEKQLKRNVKRLSKSSPAKSSPAKAALGQRSHSTKR